MPRKNPSTTKRKKKVTPGAAPVADANAIPRIKVKHMREIFGILLLALTIFLAVSLISIDPTDPSLNAVSGYDSVKNYGGKTGSYVADILYQFFGYTSLLIPPFLLPIAIRRFRKERAQHRVLKVVCSLLLFLEIAVLLQLRWSYADPFGRGLTVKTGGWIGEFLRNFFVGHFNVIGSYILVLCLFGVTLVFLTGISIQVVVERLHLMLATASNRGRSALMSVTEPLLGRFRAWSARRWHEGPGFDEDETSDEESLQIDYEDLAVRPAVRIAPDADRTDHQESIVQPSLKGRLTTRKTQKGKKASTTKEKIHVQGEFSFMKESQEYILPPPGLLADVPQRESVVLKRELTNTATDLVEKLKEFSVEGRVTQIFPGPVITRYEFEPDPGIKLSRITGLSDDLGLAMKAKVPPMVAAVPGKSVVGIDLANQKRETIFLKEIIDSEQWKQNRNPLKLALGKNTSGIPYVESLAGMPHLLVAGATGAGKSVCIHSLITSLLFTAPPEELNFIMIDPKMLELTVYNKIPHLREAVVTDPKRASQALQWAVNEMEERYKLLANVGVRNIELYNSPGVKDDIDAGKHGDTDLRWPLPYLVVIIDELADLMMIAAADVENSIARLAQMARAAGIHLIISTQRPSVNVITGIIKANFPSRIAFQVSSKIDSRTILDVNGAESLLGKGDMLFKPASGRLMRLHGAFVSEIEVQRIVEYVAQFHRDRQDESIFKLIAEKKQKDVPGDEQDELYDQAMRIIVNSGNASISMLQRRLRVGHSRAARLMDIMEQEGVVGPFEGSKPREILLKPEDLPPLEDLHYEDGK